MVKLVNLPGQKVGRQKQEFMFVAGRRTWMAVAAGQMQAFTIIRIVMAIEAVTSRTSSIHQLVTDQIPV